MTTPPGKKPAPLSSFDDPFERLRREARAAQTGIDPDIEELGDTSGMVTGKHESLKVTATYHRNEMLDLVMASLAAAPERGDLWMMRFEVLKSLGMKQEFIECLVEGWKNPRVWRQLDWNVLQLMWDELAPGEPMPEIVKRPGGQTAFATAQPIAIKTPVGTAKVRRFHDVALRIAERELAVLGKAWLALLARQGFFEEFARKVAPLLKRPTPLTYVESLSQGIGEHARVYLKREDGRGISAELDHAAGQCYIAALLGRSTVITANDVDEHVLAVTEMAPKFKLKCIVVVRPGDLQDKADLVARLRARGAQVETMPGAGMLSSDPREGAVRLWQKAAGAAHLLLSLGTAPPPYPAMANAFQALLGRETEEQYQALGAAGRARTLVAALASEADSIGFVLPQLKNTAVELVYAEPEPGGVASWRASQRLRAYNGAIREHTLLLGTGRVEHVALADASAESAQDRLSRKDNLTLSLEDARAVALTLLLAQRDRQPRDFVVLVA